MEASVRLFHSSHRHLPHSLLRRTLKSPTPSSLPPRHRHPPFSLHLHTPNSSSNSIPQFPFHDSFNFPISNNQFAHIFSSQTQNPNPFSWHYSINSERNPPYGVSKEKTPVVTAVLLGSQVKHLRRYVDLYKSRGIHCVTFVAGIGDVLSFDLGTKLEERIGSLATELAHWLSGLDKDGKERVLMFHTFSNTGWLAYGAILDNFRGRDDLLGKIKGCVVDSGGDPNIDPKVWAAGFTAALLKKRSTSASTSFEAQGENLQASDPLPTVKQKEPPLLEAFLLSAFEKLFSYLLNLPNINRRLVKVIGALNDQPPCPQLYLYSTADKVIPYKSVESLIDGQRRGGRKMRSHNFVSVSSCRPLSYTT